MAFERLPKERRTWMRTQLTEFINREIITTNGELTEVAYLNSLDRWDLAKRWIRGNEDRSKWYIGFFNEMIETYYGNYEELLDDIGCYIDSRIPKAYIKRKEHLDKALNDIRVPCGVDMTLPYGLKYHYTVNFEANLPPRQQCLSTKQEQYLASLSKKAGYLFIDREKMSKKEATDCISYFLDMKNRPRPACFNMYFVDTNEV